jgi:hypothetical protein
MRFVGLDVHKRVVQACVLNDDGSQSSMLQVFAILHQQQEPAVW